MKLHRQGISEELSRCSSKAQALFAFFCAERLRGCCWACQVGNGVNLAAFFRNSEVLFESLSKDIEPTGGAEAAFQELWAIVPRAGEPLFAQARSGLICLMTAFDILGNGSRTNITDAINETVDALNNYDFHVRRRIKNDLSISADYPLLGREKDRQLADVELVKQYDQIDRANLIDYRIANLQYIIPPAV